MHANHFLTLNKRVLICVFLCTMYLHVFPQNKKSIDSLKKSIALQKNEKKLTGDYYNLAKLYVTSDFDSALYYYNLTINLAQNQDNDKLTTEIYINLSKLLTKKLDFEKAELNAKRAIELAQKINDKPLLIESKLLAARIKITQNKYENVLPVLEDAMNMAINLNDSLLISECYDAFGTYYFYSDIPKSIDYYLKSLSFIERQIDDETILLQLTNIGSQYGRMGQNIKASEYFLRSAEIAKKYDNNFTLTTIYNNLAVIYFEMKDNAKSKYYLEEALKIARKLKDEAMICGLVVNLGELYQNEMHYDIAMEYYEEGLNSPSIENQPDQKIYTLHNIATLYNETEKYKLSISTAEEALSLANELDITVHNSDLYKVLAKAYEKVQNYEKALENHKLFKIYNDSLFNIQNTERITEIQSKYDIQKAENKNILLTKNNEIQALTIQKQNNRQLLLTGVLILIMLAIVIASFRIKKDKKIKLLLNKKNKEIKAKSLQLEQANIAKDKFVSILAHDLRNPLNSIQGSLEILSTEYYRMEDEERKEFIEMILKSTHSTNKLLVNLLDWSRIQRGGIELEKANNNIASVIAESVTLHQNQAQKKQISIHNDVQGRLMAYFDKRTISVTLNNLINNAIKYTPGQGKVSISAERVNGHVEIAVKDNGVGISKEFLKSLFKIEKNQSTPGTDFEPGTGLGLILCKEFVEKNDGDIRVFSEEGKGSCFRISLPIENSSISKM